MGFAQGTEGKERKRRESVISGERYIRVRHCIKNHMVKFADYLPFSYFEEPRKHHHFDEI